MSAPIPGAKRFTEKLGHPFGTMTAWVAVWTYPTHTRSVSGAPHETKAAAVKEARDRLAAAWDAAR